MLLDPYPETHEEKVEALNSGRLPVPDMNEPIHVWAHKAGIRGTDLVGPWKEAMRHVEGWRDLPPIRQRWICG